MNSSISLCKVEAVIDHPDANRLSLNLVKGNVVISNKNEDGTHRYKTGEKVLFVPVGIVVPEVILRDGYWDEENNRGGLGGENYDVVTPIKLRGITSCGLIMPKEKSILFKE